MDLKFIFKSFAFSIETNPLFKEVNDFSKKQRSHPLVTATSYFRSTTNEHDSNS